MSERPQIVVFSGGELSVALKDEKSSEAVLALPVDRLLLKVVSVPPDRRDDSSAYAAEVLRALSPFPDDALAVSCETVDASDGRLVVLAGALPEASADDIAQALDEAKINVRRVDARILGSLRAVLPRILRDGDAARRLLLAREDASVVLIVLDGGALRAVRAVPEASALPREVMLSLLEAEDLAGARALEETVVFGDLPAEGLETFAPVRRIDVFPDATDGLAARAAEEGAFDLLPALWRDVLEEARFKAKAVRWLALAGGVWLFAMAVLFGVPVTYGFLTDRVKALSREPQRQYRAVVEMRDKTRLVQKYSDHSHGALEILKAVSDRLPEAVTLNSWNFRRDDKVSFRGESEDATSVYKLKDELVALDVFADVRLTGPSAGKGGRQTFDIVCGYQKEEE
jgi:hypothetical protein